MGCGPVDPAGGGVRVHQHDVRADALDAAPGDPEVVLSSGDPQVAAWPGHDDGGDTALRHLHFNVGNESQPSPVTDTDNFLALQFADAASHRRSLQKDFGQSYAAGEGNMIRGIIDYGAGAAAPKAPFTQGRLWCGASIATINDILSVIFPLRGAYT